MNSRTYKVENEPSEQGFLSLLDECNHFNLEEFSSVNYAGFPIGYVHKDFVHYVSQNPMFLLDKGNLHIVEDYHDSQKLTDAFSKINRELEDNGIIRNSHGGEEYNVVHSGFTNPLFKISRAAAGFWGIRVFGVHVNGLSERNGQWHMWVAKRAKSRSAPGLLDHMVCGGLDSSLSIQENLIKEAQEEANINAQDIIKASPAGMVSCWIQTGHFLNRFTPIIYDLVLDKDFEPVNKDGAVESFSTMALDDICKQPEKIALFKVSAYPVLVNLLIRHGYIEADHPEYLSLCASLNRGFIDIINTK